MQSELPTIVKQNEAVLRMYVPVTKLSVSPMYVPHSELVLVGLRSEEPA